jgi:hypothetical protein
MLRQISAGHISFLLFEAQLGKSPVQYLHVTRFSIDKTRLCSAATLVKKTRTRRLVPNMSSFSNWFELAQALTAQEDFEHQSPPA